ncbi:hypothetical protein AHAS_Ahas19G0365200 [Arachis hypogaea]
MEVTSFPIVLKGWHALTFNNLHISRYTTVFSNDKVNFSPPNIGISKEHPCFQAKLCLHLFTLHVVHISDGDSSKLAMATNLSGKERSKEIKGVVGPSQEASWLKSTYSEKKSVLERPTNILTSFDQDDRRTLAPELQMSIVPKDFYFHELESVVKIKQAEAKMFQSRADDARREAEGLKRIALAKSGKIDEEYTHRIAKLRLGETEEMCRQKLKELQAEWRQTLKIFYLIWKLLKGVLPCEADNTLE